MGEYYEVTDEVVTKYYGGKAAMRKGTVLTYLLADHLGSNSLITSDNGTFLSETRYKPWGELHYTTGTTTTPYNYTGQYSNTADFGWMYYKARWYDNELGRFAQPDSIVPGAGDPRAWDRYSYVKNNPVRYNDPSGHLGNCTSAIDGQGSCVPKSLNKPTKEIQHQYDDWYSGNYSGCTMCHYAHAQDKSILTNNELATADSNYREWLAVSFIPSVITLGAVGGATVAEAAIGYATATTVGTTSGTLKIIEQHLSQFGDDPPNAAMLNRLKDGLSTFWDQTFTQHELQEAQNMASGLSARAAHLLTLEQQGIPYEPGYEAYLYHPEVINSFPSFFNEVTQDLSFLLQTIIK